jgi:hypothetical protein
VHIFSTSAFFSNISYLQTWKDYIIALKESTQIHNFIHKLAMWIMLEKNERTMQISNEELVNWMVDVRIMEGHASTTNRCGYEHIWMHIALQGFCRHGKMGEIAGNVSINHL